MEIRDCICAICLDIMIEPVTMPCLHELCTPCFRTNVQETSLTCPLCRMRISSWARRATRENKLINQARWREIKKAFPNEIRRRQIDNTDGIDTTEFPAEKPRLAEPGEVRKEYLEQLRKVQEELRIQRELEERQSVELIRQLHDEDRAMRAEHDLRMKKDRLVASQETCSSTVNDALKLRSMSAGQKHTSSCSEMTTRVASAPVRCNAEFQAPPGPGKENKRQHASSRSKSRETSSNPSSTFLLPSNPSSSLSSLSGSSGGSMAMESGGGFASQASSGGVVDAATTSSGGSSSSSSNSKGKHHRSHSVESNDSISEELRHFKPIHAMPRTPPRRMTSGKVLEPVIVHCTPRKHVNIGEEGATGTHAAAVPDASSPIVQRRLKTLAAERRRYVAEHSRGTATDAARVPPAAATTTAAPPAGAASSAVKLLRFDTPDPAAGGDARPDSTSTPGGAAAAGSQALERSPGRLYRMKPSHRRRRHGDARPTQCESVSSAGDDREDDPAAAGPRDDTDHNGNATEKTLRHRRHASRFLQRAADSEIRRRDDGSIKGRLRAAAWSDAGPAAAAAAAAGGEGEERKALEQDRLFALRLQRRFDAEDRGVYVDRTRGSVNEYALRKRSTSSSKAGAAGAGEGGARPKRSKT